jgi:transketolase
LVKHTDEVIKKLESKAKDIRRDIIEMIYHAKSGHPGGSLSATDLVTALYFHILNIDPARPRWEDRDRFILSKGHACPVLYSALAERGYFGMPELATLRKYHSILQGHPDMNKTPGIDMTSGSLGNGLSAGLGMALAAKWKNRDYRVYVMLGDGELNEGIVWEAAMAASHHKLDNLVAIVDCNGLQITGRVEDVMNIEPLPDKWKAFGWAVIGIDGHNMREIVNAFELARAMTQPMVILAKTVKGKGVSFMENNADWHGKALDDEHYATAKRELNRERTN